MDGEKIVKGLSAAASCIADGAEPETLVDDQKAALGIVAGMPPVVAEPFIVAAALDSAYDDLFGDDGLSF